MASFTVFFPCGMKFAYCKRWPECCGNLAMKLQVCLLCSTIQLSPLSGWPRWRTDKARYKSIRDPLAANFASRVGLCARIVETFKHLLCVTTHPQFLALELWAATGVCPGQYSTTTDSLASLVDMHQAAFVTCHTKCTGSSTEHWSLPEVWEQAYS